MADFYCAYCGKYGDGRTGQGPVSTPSKPNGWLQNKSWGFGIKYYCSKKCKLADEGIEDKSSFKGPSKSSGSSISNLASEMLKSEDQKMRDSGLSSAEIASIKTAKEETKAAEANASAIREQEYTKRKIAEQQIGLEKIKLREDKIKQLRAEKKYVRVFAMEHPYLFGIASFILFSLFLKIVMFFTTLGDAEKIQKSTEQSQNIEIIENKIILGINSKEPKEKLLELISQLKHSDTENKIEGKKRDIIDKGIPDSDFYGTFSEYWSAKREAYKNIVLKGLTIDEYLNKKESDESSVVENVKVETIEYSEAQDDITIEGIAEKVYFYDKPNYESKTKGYFVKGQTAKLLGEAGDFSKVHFEFNGKVTEKFVLSNQIQEVDTYVPAEPDTEGLDPEYQEN